jgi:hypothetical protein
MPANSTNPELCRRPALPNPFIRGRFSAVEQLYIQQVRKELPLYIKKIGVGWGCILGISNGTPFPRTALP